MQAFLSSAAAPAQNGISSSNSPAAAGCGAADCAGAESCENLWLFAGWMEECSDAPIKKMTLFLPTGRYRPATLRVRCASPIRPRSMVICRMGEGAQRRTHQKNEAFLAYSKNRAPLIDASAPVMQHGIRRANLSPSTRAARRPGWNSGDITNPVAATSLPWSPRTGNQS